MSDRRLRELVGAPTERFGGGALRRSVVDPVRWDAIGVELARDPALSLVAYWGEPSAVHAALRDMVDGSTAVVTCTAQRVPSIGRHHAPAIRLERTIRDLYAIEFADMPDRRPWLDHGNWRPQAAERAPYAFLRADGDGLHQIAVGPVHAGIIEPGHFRFTANGETVVRLEERLGYVHKGLEALWVDCEVGKAARIAGRVSGDSTVATSLAFARAVEAAYGVIAPPRAQWLRALMAELERIANHLGDIGAICNDASFALIHAHCGVLREHVLRASRAAFGHRLMMDRVVPGGVAVDLSTAGKGSIVGVVSEIRGRFPRLVELYDDTPSLQDRTVGTGRLDAALATQFAAGGYVGRAAGRAFDARSAIGYPPYDALAFDVPTRTGGDVNDRVWIRIREIEQSLSLIDQLLERLPSGPIDLDETHRDAVVSEGVALVEGFRGDYFAWVRIDEHGRIARCHLRDPSWFQWPLLEAVVEGNIVADFPLCNKSFNCSYSGHDL
jgi:Ni,Fe-hydrogenase III large subunit